MTTIRQLSLSAARRLNCTTRRGAVAVDHLQRGMTTRARQPDRSIHLPYVPYINDSHLVQVGLFF